MKKKVNQTDINTMNSKLAYKIFDLLIIDNDKFYQEFKKLPYVEGEYNNEYNPARFNTEEECINFLNSIGLKRV